MHLYVEEIVERKTYSPSLILWITYTELLNNEGWDCGYGRYFYRKIYNFLITIYYDSI